MENDYVSEPGESEREPSPGGTTEGSLGREPTGFSPRYRSDHTIQVPEGRPKRSGFRWNLLWNRRNYENVKRMHSAQCYNREWHIKSRGDVKLNALFHNCGFQLSTIESEIEVLQHGIDIRKPDLSCG